MNDLELAVQWASKGMKLVSSNSEIGFLMKRGTDVTTAISSAFPPLHSQNRDTCLLATKEATP